MVLRFENGSFVSVSEGAARIGSMAVSLGSGPAPVTTTVIPSRTDSLFLRLAAERVSSISRGVAIVSSNVQGELDPDSIKALMGGIIEMVKNV